MRYTIANWSTPNSSLASAPFSFPYFPPTLCSSVSIPLLHSLAYGMHHSIIPQHPNAVHSKLTLEHVKVLVLEGMPELVWRHHLPRRLRPLVVHRYVSLCVLVPPKPCNPLEFNDSPFVATPLDPQCTFQYTLEICESWSEHKTTEMTRTITILEDGQL